MLLSLFEAFDSNHKNILAGLIDQYKDKLLSIAYAKGEVGLFRGLRGQVMRLPLERGMNDYGN